jgi:LacI family transcriptional regulator
MFGNSTGGVTRERQLIRDFTSRRLDAIIVAPAAGDHRHLHPAWLSGMPVVLAAHPPSGFDADCVLLDDFGGSQDATRLC